MKLITTVSLNMLLAFMIPLGIVMMGDTRWGVIIMMIPVIFWGGRFLLFVHKSKWAAGLFWLGITYLQWQVAIGILCAFLVFLFIRKLLRTKAEYTKQPSSREDDEDLYALSTDISTRSRFGLHGGVGIGDD
ncbi:hypothetical protein HLX14_004072 [Escherichia coli]|uniref:Permease n=1 Tax=Edwardsiella anguillarum ET080813 TaxID=667120 RepID=A0A076LVD2_9GAMM|nr:hypothetical protein [Edwardsiella anguillarum]EFP0183605.1 hypothetical protein [Escherichia coli]EGA8339544.1 hypothetical protein [Salmonella enterica subsp. enterica serovar Saintpaul]EKG9744511.1 hypothetical protein [Salmonella enterica]EKS7763294.1 hypothetical protein [Edwardsiella ictaluri]AIJ10627.1 Hypothetical protein ETEE_p1036 [Edwardsiella anguillarum ET080813]